MSLSNRRYGQHVQTQRIKQQQSEIRAAVRDRLEEVNKLVATNRFDEGGEILVERVLPLLGSLPSTDEWHYYHSRLVGEDTRPWDWNALYTVLTEADSVIENAANGDPDACQTIQRAAESVESICTTHGIVQDELRNYARATGFSLPLGVLYKKYEFQHADEVQLVSNTSGHPKTIYNGETGEGKSTALSADVEDRFNSGYKVIDVIDTDEMENAVYDIPQQQDVLRDVREEMGLPPDFNEANQNTQPNIEVLVPLTDNLHDFEFPYDTESDQFRIRPFTIPAADLVKRSLLGFLKTVVTPQQEVAIGVAYEELKSEKDDWTLADLADYVDRQEGLADNFKIRVRKLVQNLQRKGFIRTRECPHALDWEEIFRDTDTITAFSQAMVEEREDKLMVIAYLTHSLYNRRKPLRNLPDCVGVFREMHEIVGHQNTRSDDEREKAIQQTINTELAYIMRKNRHEDLELITDTQDFTDLERGVRKRFNRAVTFLTQDDVIEELFEKVAGSRKAYRDYGDTVADHFGKGKGTIFGKTGPNATSGLKFLTPVKFAPPSWHVLDTDGRDDVGWIARAEYHEHEELRDPPWDTSIPTELEIPDESTEPEDQEETLNAGTLMKAHKHEARRRRSDGESYRGIIGNIPNNPKTGNGYSTSTIKDWVEDVKTPEEREAEEEYE